MRDEIFIQQQKRITISDSKNEQSVEIGSSAIDKGFLKQFPGPALAILLYLITHLQKGNYVMTNVAIIASYLPDNYDLKAIEEALNLLVERDIVEISPRREGDYTCRIKVNLENLTAGLATDYSGWNKMEEAGSTGPELRRQVLAKATPSEEEIKEALFSFAPPGKKGELVRAEIEKWLADFDLQILKELIRRVDKWIAKNDNPPERAFHYLEGIIDDWYRKEIFSYRRLKHFDRLYRETRELAFTYGIKGWQNVKPAHMETFKSWLEGDFPLSLPLAKLAIREAVKRKKDGQPSLKYIEDNFIRPWKEARVKTVEEAKKLLNSSETSSQKNSGKMGREQNWEELNWDFTDYDGLGG